MGIFGSGVCQVLGFKLKLRLSGFLNTGFVSRDSDGNPVRRKPGSSLAVKLSLVGLNSRMNRTADSE